MSKHGRLLALAPIALALSLTACSVADDDTSAPKAQSATSLAEGAPDAADEAAVRRRLDDINRAWAQGDAEKYASFHTSDADLVDFRGIHVTGRQEIVGLLQPLFDGPLDGTRVDAGITDLRFLAPDVAIMHAEGQIVPTGGNSTQTFVLTKNAERWLIAAFQNTRIQAP